VPSAPPSDLLGLRLRQRLGRERQAAQNRVKTHGISRFAFCDDSSPFSAYGPSFWRANPEQIEDSPGRLSWMSGLQLRLDHANYYKL
jgi:hypothetical protein